MGFVAFWFRFCGCFWLIASCQLLAAKFSKIVTGPHPLGLLHPTPILPHTHARTCTPSPVTVFCDPLLEPRTCPNGRDACPTVHSLRLPPIFWHLFKRSKAAGISRRSSRQQ